jgi:N-acetyl sugar amidotransferase
MDTSDPEIEFDANGVCNHCHTYDRMIKKSVLSGAEGQRRLGALVERIKREGAGKQYDCIIGVSGGVDSTFVAYKVKQLGLRPLAVHLDNGWDSELAVSNIHKGLNTLNIDLHTHVMDWEEFRDLQLSFLKASTPDSEIPSDHAIFALLYQMADKTGVRYVLTGLNVRTESHLPAAWSQGHIDWKYIQSVHRQFGTVPLKTFPYVDLATFLRYSVTQKWIGLLNYLDYNKAEAMQVLEKELGWKYYGGKHYESIYTRFYQGYILPRKFGFDKRRTHLSSLICSGEISRAEALEKLKEEIYPLALQEEDLAYVIKKFGLTKSEFDAVMNAPKKSFWDFPSYGRLRKTLVYKGARVIYRALTG